jgi:hypothetical protein
MVTKGCNQRQQLVYVKKMVKEGEEEEKIENIKELEN